MGGGGGVTDLSDVANANCFGNSFLVKLKSR